jgi:ABC-type nickel/cobalt efflux system permease component RcnA
MEQSYMLGFLAGATFGVMAVIVIRWTVKFLSGPSEKEQLIDEMLEDYKENGKLW